MNRLKYYLSIITIAAGLGGCTLESEVYEAINPTIFPQTEADAEALVTANAYGVFRNNGYDGMFNIANGVLLISDLISDYGECSWRGWEPVLYNRWQIGNTYIDYQYRYPNYLGKMTMTIDRIEKMDLKDDVKKRFIAELRCARGWLAFCMYDLYGPIPIADLETLQDPLAEKILPRLSEEEMKNYIETEIKAAMNDLPANFKKGDSEFGRFTSGLCHMILLKYYMQTKQWEKAEAEGRELMKPEYGYSLVPEYKNIFTLENEKNAETIWAVNCLPGYQQHKWHPHVLPNDYPTDPEGVVKWNGFKLSWAFMKTFEEGDKRLETIITEYTGTEGKEHNEELDRANGDLLYYGAVPFKYEIDKATTGEDNHRLDYLSLCRCIDIAV